MAEPTRPWSVSLSPSLIAGACLAGLLVVVAIFAPLLLSDAANTLQPAEASLPPSAAHPLGTDDFGRDILARCLVATRLTLVMCASATAISAILGILIGGSAWLAGHRTRTVILRMVDATVAFPSLILALVIAAVLGAGVTSSIVAIGLAGVPAFARITSSMVSAIVHRDYVVTARRLGVPPGAILTRHLLPNVSGSLLVLVASSFSLSLLEISSLSFVGLGVQSPEYDYGRLLADGLPKIFVQPMAVVGPSAMLVIAGVAIMLLGDGLADATDPRRRRARPQVNLADSAEHERPRPRTDAAAAEVPTPFPGDAIVRVRDLTVVSRAGRTLVSDVSLELAPGRVLGIVGESGSGKSVTAMTIAGLLDETLTARASEVSVAGMDMLRSNRRDALARNVSLVFQDPGTTFNPAKRMGSQLTEVLRVHMGVGGRAARATMTEALDRVHIVDPAKRLHQHPHELSGGMLQRAAIASALVTEPRLIIADEPTTALDVTVQAQVLKEFRARRGDTSMLFISHDIGVVKELCDDVIVMKSGEIIERLTGDALRRDAVTHPYTQQLLDATPIITRSRAFEKETAE